MSQHGFALKFASLMAALGFFIPLAAQAQTPTNSIAPPPTPVQRSAPRRVPLNPKLPTVFIIGDSTARNQANLGWGDHFAHFFNTSRITVLLLIESAKPTRGSKLPQ